MPENGPFEEDLGGPFDWQSAVETQCPDLPGGGLSRYPMIYIGEGYNRIFIINDGKIVWKYDTDWNVVRTFNVPKPWAAIRLKNGNTLITLEDERRTIEVDKDDKVVWEIRLDEIPEKYRPDDCQSVCRLQNGNIILCSRGGYGKTAQLVEVTPQKEVVWVVNDWKNLGPATSVQILNEQGFSEIPGDLER